MIEIFIGVASSLIATVITAKYYSFKYQIDRDNRIIKLFGMNPEKNIKICYANIQNSAEYSSPIASLIPNGSFDYGDADSILQVYDRFRSHFHHKIRWVRNEIPALSKNGNLITIAGPKWNASTEQLIGEIGSPLFYRTGILGLIEKRTTHQQENIHEFNYIERDKYIEIEDYGCIICARNNILGKDIDCAVVISGFSTFGTLFASEALNSLTKSEVGDVASSIGNDNKFALLVRGSLKLDLEGKIVTPAKIEIVTWIGERDFLTPYRYEY